MYGPRRKRAARALLMFVCVGACNRVSSLKGKASVCHFHIRRLMKAVNITGSHFKKIKK